MSKRVLVVEDSTTIKKTIELALTLEDYQLDIVETPLEALSKVQGLLPDILICDVSLPGMDGYELSENIIKSSKGKKIPILLLVGSFEAFDKEKANAIGIDELMIKPFESIIFIEKVRELINKGITEIMEEEALEIPSEEILEAAEASFPAEIPFVEADAVSLSGTAGEEVLEGEAFELDLEPVKEFKEEIEIAEVVEEPAEEKAFDSFHISEHKDEEILAKEAADIQHPAHAEEELFETVKEVSAGEEISHEPSIDELFTVEAVKEPSVKPHGDEAAWDILEEALIAETVVLPEDQAVSEKTEAVLAEEIEKREAVPFKEEAFAETSILEEFLKPSVAAPEKPEIEIAEPIKEKPAEPEHFKIEPVRAEIVRETFVAPAIKAPSVSAAEEEEEIVIKSLSSMLSNEIIAEITEKAVKSAVEEAVWGVVPELIEEVKKIASLKLQEIAWEVMPELAEKYIIDEIERLKKEQ